jgi:hypothetical protein
MISLLVIYESTLAQATDDDNIEENTIPEVL